MSDPHEPAVRGSSPALGRFVAGLLLALFVMVALGIYSIWTHARGEKDWRERINARENFITPTNRPASR